MKNKKFGLLITVFAILTILSSCSTTRYYIVRHAEKNNCDDCATCNLSNAGTLRAIALRDTMVKKSIDTIFTSQCLRTQLTAQPTATQLHKTLSKYTQLNSFIENLKAFDNKNLLIVSHSPEIPMIVSALCGQQVTVNEFNRMFIVTKTKFLGKTTTAFKETTYGQPN